MLNFSHQKLYVYYMVKGHKNVFTKENGPMCPKQRWKDFCYLTLNVFPLIQTLP